MTLALPDLDLPGRVRLAWQYIGNALDERRGYRPFFSWALAESPAYALHTHYDMPHVVGRFLDALLGSAELADAQPDAEVERILTDLLFQTISPDDALGWSDSGAAGVPEALIHDQRELLYALADLIRFRDSDDARRACARFSRSVQRLIGDSDAFPGYALRASGWDVGEGHSFYYAPTNSGRLVHALLRYYRLSHDEVALNLARRFADDNRARCFTEDGRLTDAAGIHLHSVAGTVEGFLELGLLLGEREYVEHARRIYDVGFSPYRSSFGWVKENIRNATLDGEANNTGDLMRIALLLGQHGYPEYFEDAERGLRNHLLASQLLDAGWVQGATGEPDTDERSYRDIGRRAVGGFGFTTVADWMIDLTPGRRAKRFPLNADIVQGSLQAIVACWEAAVTKNAAGTWVNLFLDRSAHGVSVTDRMASAGRVTVTAHESTALFLRRPSWATAEDISLSINGERRSLSVQGRYLFVPGLSAGDTVEAAFVRRPVSTVEHVDHYPFSVTWYGDHVLDLQPRSGNLPLYGART